MLAALYAIPTKSRSSKNAGRANRHASLSIHRVKGVMMWFHKTLLVCGFVCLLSAILGLRLEGHAHLECYQDPAGAYCLSIYQAPLYSKQTRFVASQIQALIIEEYQPNTKQALDATTYYCVIVQTSKGNFPLDCSTQNESVAQAQLNQFQSFLKQAHHTPLIYKPIAQAREKPSSIALGAISIGLMLLGLFLPVRSRRRMYWSPPKSGS